MDKDIIMIKQITGVLDLPEKISNFKEGDIELINGKYPYFMAGRYLQAAKRHTRAPFASDMMDGMQLYMGNWLLFHQFLNDAPWGKADAASSAADFSVVVHLAEPEPQVDAAPINEEQEPMGRQESVGDPLFVQDYFKHEGLNVPDEIPAHLSAETKTADEKLRAEGDEKSLMVVRDFTEWLLFYKKKKEYERSEEDDKRALKAMWQREKLAAAIEEGGDEIPEQVFEMAVNSITEEDGLITESLAEILMKQGKYDKAIEMYRKLSLRNPEKNAYFARKIEHIHKQQDS